MELKVIAMGESLEVYADDRLLIHNVRYREQRGRNSQDESHLASLLPKTDGFAGLDAKH